MILIIFFCYLIRNLIVVIREYEEFKKKEIKMKDILFGKAFVMVVLSIIMSLFVLIDCLELFGIIFITFIVALFL